VTCATLSVARSGIRSGWADWPFGCTFASPFARPVGALAICAAAKVPHTKTAAVKNHKATRRAIA